MSDQTSSDAAADRLLAHNDMRHRDPAGLLRADRFELLRAAGGGGARWNLERGSDLNLAHA